MSIKTSSSPYRSSTSYIKDALDFTLFGAKLVPGLETAAGVVQSIIDQADKLKSNRETCEALVEQVRISQATIEKYKPLDDDFQEAYLMYIDILTKIDEYIKQLRRPGNFSRRFINKMLRFMHAKGDEQLLKQFSDALAQAIRAFNLEVNVQICNVMSKQSKAIKEIELTTLEIKNIAKGFDARRSDVEKTRIDPNLITNDPLEKEVVRGKKKALVRKMYRSQSVAVKKLRNNYSELNEKDKTRLVNEAVIRKLLSGCDNIEKFHGTYVDSNSLYIVTEWAENGNLCDRLQKKPNIPWNDKWRIASEIANAINFCHGVEVLHHNIRAKNVLLDKHMTTKLSNFVTSRQVDQTTTSIPGIRDGLEWRAPEKIRSEVEKRKLDLQPCEDARVRKSNDIKYETLPFNKQMDVYSFGMTLWEIAANGESPFFQIEDFDLENEIIAGARPLIPDDTPPEFAKFIKKAWEDKWDKRPKIDVIANKLFKIFRLLEEDSHNKDCLNIPPSDPPIQRPLTPVASSDFPKSTNHLPSKSLEPLTLSSFEEIIKMHNDHKYKEALPYFEAYAEKGDPRAAYLAGKYFCEIPQLHDEERGLALIQQAAETKLQPGRKEMNEYIPKAQCYYAKILLQPRTYQPKKAIYYLKLASNNRRYEADCKLAEIYMEGDHNQEIDLKRSENYLNKIFASKNLQKENPIYKQAEKLLEQLNEYKNEAEINNDEKDSIVC